MVIFSAYRHTDSSWRQRWRESSGFNEMLSRSFDNILTAMRMPLLRRQLPSLFNTCRDRVRDHLSTIDPISFPRFGQSPISASDIFVRMGQLEGDRHLVSLKFTCDDKSHRSRSKGYNATFVVVVHNVSLAERPTLQLWVSSYFREMRSNSPLCRLCRTPYPLIVVSHSALVDLDPRGRLTVQPR